EAGEEMADIIEDEFEEIYPDEDKVQTMSTMTLRELRRTNAPSVLVEVAYHDNVEDANWIKNNIQPIARALSRSLADYFGIPFIEPMD
ncbi:MAG: N-acetylmuramoyl-L-alanine amidase, partial [Anaerotignum sp.]|nr:N-acetylmuramoyl-L-alanine amidase [Anaerotignum sp.]